MVTGCGSGSESVAKTEEDAISVETDSQQETDKEETANAKTTETESKDVCKCPINTAYSPYTLLWGSIGNANLFMQTLCEIPGLTISTVMDYIVISTESY